jgi:hypothetical protein
MAFETRQVTHLAPDSNITQDFEVEGFGTPQAAIIIASDSGNGSWTNDGQLCMGFWDGTNENCVGAGYNHGQSIGSAPGRHYSTDSNCVWAMVSGTSANERKATVSSTLDHGIELTWSGTSPSTWRPYTTVILIKGCNGVQTGFRTANTADEGETQTTTTGMTPKLILFNGRLTDSSSTGHSSDPRWFHGFACDNGSGYDNYMVGWRNRHDANPTDMNGAVYNTGCIPFDCGVGGAISGYATVTEMTENSFTTTTTEPGTPITTSHFYLALDFDESVVGFAATTPQTSGDWDPYSASFTPQWFFAFPTGFPALNTPYGGGEDGVECHQIYSVIKNPASSATIDEDGYSCIVENGSTSTIYAQSRYDTQMMIAVVDSGPSPDLLITGDSPTFDSSGVVYADANFSHDGGGDHQVIGFFVQETQTGASGTLLGPISNNAGF